MSPGQVDRKDVKNRPHIDQKEVSRETYGPRSPQRWYNQGASQTGCGGDSNQFSLGREDKKNQGDNSIESKDGRRDPNEEPRSTSVIRVASSQFRRKSPSEPIHFDYVACLALRFSRNSASASPAGIGLEK